MVVYETRCVSEDVVVYISVFQGRMSVVVDSVDEEDQAEEDGED